MGPRPTLCFQSENTLIFPPVEPALHFRDHSERGGVPQRISQVAAGAGCPGNPPAQSGSALYAAHAQAIRGSQQFAVIARPCAGIANRKTGQTVTCQMGFQVAFADLRQGYVYHAARPEQLLGRGAGAIPQWVSKSCCASQVERKPARNFFSARICGGLGQPAKNFRRVFFWRGQQEVFICRGGLMGVGEEVSSSGARLPALILMRPAKQDARVCANAWRRGIARAQAPSTVQSPGEGRAQADLSKVPGCCHLGMALFNWPPDIPCRQIQNDRANSLQAQASEGFFLFAREIQKAGFWPRASSVTPDLNSIGWVMSENRLSIRPRPKPLKSTKGACG